MGQSNNHYVVHRRNRRKCWARRTLACSTLLPLLVSPLNGLCIPSGSGSFVGLPRIRDLSTRLRAVLVEEDESLLETNREIASFEEDAAVHSSFPHYAFEPTVSVQIVNVDDIRQTIPHRNGYSDIHFQEHRYRHPSESPATTVHGNKINEEERNGHTQSISRVVNGVCLPPYDSVRNGSTLSVLNEPPITSDVVYHNGNAQPPQPSHNGNTQPLNQTGLPEEGAEDIKQRSDADAEPTHEPREVNAEPSDDDEDDGDGDMQLVVSQEEDEHSPPTVRKLWQRRHARSIEEGVRCEKTREKTTQLSKLLSKAPLVVPPKRGYFARTISGLITALAEEADGLEVDVDAQEETPLWRKNVDAIRINFSRLGFKPLRMGGLDEAIRSLEMELPDSQVDRLAENLELNAVSSADEAFDRIDEDKSGALDRDEIAKALNLAASSDSDDKVLHGLASQLVELYDFNGDGVVDREEYQNLVADMATLRREEMSRLDIEYDEPEITSGIRGALGRFSRWLRRKPSTDEVAVVMDEEGDMVVEENQSIDVVAIKEEEQSSNGVVNISNDSAMNSVAKRGGSIVLEDLKIDLRQLVFGVVPVLKRITPGGPLVLEPFTATVTGSFTPEDIKASMLLDMGLRLLVARALRRRVRSFRDLVDGAVFYGRRWNLASKSAPKVEVPELTKVEFDKQDRMILTGRAQVRTSPDAPFIENAFKVRTKIGTRNNGQSIRLVEPELAFVLECPKSWEKTIRLFIGSTGLPIPKRPKPLYSFFPIYSPFKMDDNDGFDLGEDNKIKSIFIKDGALQFELSAVLRPGRFLGSHYLAFTLPMRTFIITMERVREGIRTARQNKRDALAKAKLLKSSERKDKGRNYLDVVAQSLSSQELVADRRAFRFADTRQDKKIVVIPKPQSNKSFFSRFVDGYLGSRSDGSEHHARLMSAISDWFGRQSAKSNDEAANGPSTNRDNKETTGTPRRRMEV